MYKQSNEAKLAYQSAERTLDIVVNVNGVDYKATDIEQFDYDSGGYTGDTFSIGSTYENNITVKFIHLVEGLKRGMIVKPRIGIKLPNETFEYTPLGVFIIADEIQMDRNNNSTTIKAYDKFVVMEGQYVSKLTYPANAVDIITEIAQMCKVDVNTDDLAHLPTIKVSKAITKQSYRTAIGWIAQLYVGFASFDRDGKLTIRRVAEPNYTIEPSEYEQQGLVKNEAPYIIGGISCNVNVVETTNNGETNETTHKLHSGSVNGSQIELTNDIMTQSLLDSIWDSLKSITFYPFSLNWFGNPAIEAGDWLSLKDMKGNVFVVPNNGYTISFNGGLSSKSKADQNATDSSTVKYTGELTRAIENYSRRQAPDGTNIYTDVQEPTDAKFNDVWFKPNGNSTELWIFERQTDGSGKWVKQPVNGEVEQKINDTLKEFDELDKSFKDNANAQSSTNELMKSRIDSISNQIPNLSDEISRVNGNVTSLKTQTDKDHQQLQTTSQNLDQARQDLLSNSNRIDKLTVDLDSVNINVNNINSKVDNMQVGGTNLIPHSEVDTIKEGIDYWVFSTGSNTNYGGRYNSTDKSLELEAHLKDTNYQFMQWQQQNNVLLNTELAHLKVGDTITVSAEVYIENKDMSGNITLGFRVNPKTNYDNYFSTERAIDLRDLKNGWQRVSATGTITQKYLDCMNNLQLMRVLLAANGIKVNTKIAFRKIKVEKGNVPTDWSPAPEDEIERVAQLRVDLNGMNATVATNKGDIAQIKLTENGMQQSIKDAQGNISTLQNDSKQFKQQFQDINGNIADINNNAKSLNSQLSTKVGTSEYNSFKEQTAQELRTKLTASDLNGYAKSVDVKVSVDGLNARFDNLNVGGTNLLKKTSNDWKTWTGTGWANNTVDGGYINLEPGTYTFRAEIDNTGNTQRGVHTELYVVSEKKFLDQIAKSYTQTFVNAGSKGYVTTTFTIDKALTDVAIHPHAAVNSAIPSTVTIKWRREKLEKGNIATDWSPAPEDMTDRIEVLSGKITTNSNEFSTVYTKITNAKNDAINTIKGDSQWQSMGKIVTNASFLQNANGFAQEVSKRITNDTGQTNLYYNSEFTYSGNDPHNIDGISSTGNVAYSKNDRWSNYKGSNAVFASTRGTLSDYYYIEHKKDKYVKVQPGEVVSASVVTWVTGGSDVPRDGYAICTISFYKDLNSSRMGYKETSVAAKDINYPYYRTLKVENVTVPDGANYMTLHLIIRGASNWQFSQPMLVKDDHVGVYVPSTQLQLNQVIDTADSHTRTITDYLTGSNSRFVQMANYLNMNVGNSSVSINGDGVMLSGNRIKITGKTLIDNAVILDALIKDINANTIKTKTLDASKINVTNLNANNITSGTLSGPNFRLNLDEGNMKIGIADKSKSIILDNGKIDLYSSDVLSSSDYVGTITTVKGGPANHAIRIAGNDGFLIGTEDFTNNFFADGGYPWGTDPKNYVSGSGIFGYKQNMTITTGPTRDNSTLAMVAGAIPSDNLGNIFGARAQPGVYIFGRDNAHKDLSFAAITAPLATAFNTRYGSIRVGNRLFTAGWDGTDTSLDKGEIALSLYAPNNNYPGLSIKPWRISLGAVPGGFVVSDPELSLDLENKKANLNATSISISADKELDLFGKPVSVYGDLSVVGSKNAVVPSSKGYIAINAYETAEYYFGDIGESQTDKQGVKIINLDPLFLETVNTSVPYQVFLSSYDDAKVWVFARNNNMFIVKSDKPNVKFAWEIKAKRKDYENVRLKTVDLKNERN
ncbi:hypothetical protein O2U01_00470 [Ligilactobacillus salivarius]|uniref:Peptidase S74 domain-containing protein n=1 Tax=Ligilactobacillus salivarius TaxID=1624 RepID=A0ABD7YTB0_9LACO|nr:hypothetical protein [Ligilactobacillus salivarius]WHS06326.1 hypothetical protein O2U07_03255 [Ligilactobacillus salivarius]WHS07591.1 hypothetical protein O2U05_07495 [Ligilactobacillus salivarius]WHS10245.1 hypothetical protein O2U04_01330 [Ligilactobacillus salivarius]WHS14182.1 hypothetical protein O2U03_00545 [Ligilactobacillus salivarius]WHS17202.1 hypothetical protein O2U02_06890 [Ligilactobacillus salivarius]